MHTSIRTFLGTAICAGYLVLTACGDGGDTSSGSGKATIPDEPDAAIQTIMREIGGGNTAILWEAMPAGYRTDINDIAQLAGTKIDPELYDKTFDLIGRIGGVVSKQKEFILNNPQFAGQPEADKEKFEKAIPSIAALLETVAASNVATAEGLQTFEGEAFFDTTVAKISDHVMTLSKLTDEGDASMADLKEATVKVVEREGDTATLEMTIANEPPETEIFKQVEGRWVPVGMADQWSAKMGEARANLESMTPEDMAAQKPQIMGVLGMMDGVVTQLETAETQQQFDQALQQAMMPLMGLMMMGQGMGGGQGGGGGGGAAPMPMPMPEQAPAQ